MYFPRSTKSGFTLIELLVVMGIITILSSVVLVALNPTKRFADARNSRRITAVNTFLTAIYECVLDNDGVLASCIGSLTTDEVYEITSIPADGACNAVCTIATSVNHCADIDTLLAAYLKELPVDPSGVTTGHTGYAISRDTNNILTITACAGEGDIIKVSR